MSGVEAAAGLALGVLPLLISAAEHYDKCWRPFIRYKDFAKEADRFQSLLGIQKTIFRNQCRILLEQILEHDVASAMLNGPSGANHPLCSDIELGIQLSQLLGDSTSACVTAVEMIEERLRDIDSESQGLAITIDQHSQGILHPVGSKLWRRCVAKKLRFSFSKPRLDQTLCDLRSLNDDFKTLSTQTLKSTSLQLRGQASLFKKPYQEVERYQIVGQASCQVYEALGRACTKHTEHQAHFCVEAEQANIDHSAQVKFSMAYTHLTLAGSADRNDLIWFVVDSTSGDTMEPGVPVTTTGYQTSLQKSLKRQIECTTGATRKKTPVRVRFQSESLVLPHVSSTVSNAATPNAILSNDSMRKDFCDLIRRRLRGPLQTSECVGVLEGTDRCRNFVYPSPNNCCNQSRQATSLEQVISNISRRQTTGGLALYERLRLAKTLAMAVIQYHSTPWLRLSWRSEDIYFFDRESTSSQSMPSLTSPHLNVKVKGPCGQLSRASTFPPHNLARNPHLFSLGVVLLEIAYTSTMERLRKPIDLENGRENRYTEFFAARRLAKSAKTDMGTTYHKIVQKLIECDFGTGMEDLNEPQLQAAFHHDVICPLEKLEQKLQDFQID